MMAMLLFKRGMEEIQNNYLYASQRVFKYHTVTAIDGNKVTLRMEPFFRN
jgi:hypothetical protein